MRLRFTYAAVLMFVAAIFAPYTASAAEVASSASVASTRYAAEQLLLELGIDPGSATYQIGAFNYAGDECPGSGWNCTTASVVVQIGTGLITSSNTASCDANPPSSVTSGTNPCVIVQSGTGDNHASCIQFSSDASTTQRCSITQTTTSGRNRARVSQSVNTSDTFLASGFDSQSAKQLVRVRQSNTMGENDSTINQTIRERQHKQISGTTDAKQHQEGHQNVFVCQGGGDPCAKITTATPSNPRNISDVDQTQFLNLKVRFQTGSSGVVKQDQNTDPNCSPATCATSLAVVQQNSFDKKNDARFLNFSRPTASVRNANDNHDDEDDTDDGASNTGFGGTIIQRQGKAGTCQAGFEGLCGFEFQDSKGVETAHERQDELKRLIAPKSLPKGSCSNQATGTVCQIQFGEEFCCATQTPGNNDNVNRVTLRKVGRHTHSETLLRAHGHCKSPNSPDSPPTAPKDNCDVNVTVIEPGNPSSPQSQHCVGDDCNVLVVCQSGVEGGSSASCTGGSTEGTPTPPPSECVFEVCGPAPIIGDVILGVASGTYQVRTPTGTLKETLTTSSGFTTGCAFDAAGNFYGTWFTTNNVFKFNGTPPHASSSFGGGYSTPESIVFDKTGNVYVGNVTGSAGIRKFAADGTFIKTVISTRVDWLDLAADQDTILYTQEGTDIKRVSQSTGLSGPNFTTGTARQAFALRILSDGGVLLADGVNLKRYNASGIVIQTYTTGTENSWFSLNLDPNGTSFWAGNINSANYYRFNITTGAVEIGPINTGTGTNTLFGICVKGEITAGG